jgi:N-acetylglucosamine-6-phosphate deacetylase
MNYLSIYGKKSPAATVGSAPMTHLVEQLREVHLDVPSVAAPTAPVDDHTETIQITNCRILKDGKLVSEDSLWVQNGKIVDPRPFFWEAKQPPHKLVDGRGLIVIPGYIDIQLNGGFGADFSSDTDKIVEGLERVSKGLPQYGCTAYCPTIVSSHADIYEHVLPHLKPRKGSKEDGAEIIGAHLEGPFIAMAKVCLPFTLTRSFREGHTIQRP